MTESEPLPHERAFELLPWLVNGTLTTPEREAVEQHARTCIACRRELKEQQSLHAAVRARRTADLSADAGFDRLRSELDPAPTVAARRRGRYASAVPFAVAAAAGGAVLAILLWFTPLPRPSADTYSTLATTPVEEVAKRDLAQLDIIFAETTTAAEIKALLDEIGGTIVAGPTPVGRYRVRLLKTAPDAARVAELVSRLGTDRRVRFAGPALADMPP